MSYYYPPMGGVGVQRASSLVKYFPENKLCPIVVTSPYDSHHVIDRRLLELPHIKDTLTHRIGESDPLRKFLERRLQGADKSLADLCFGLASIRFMDVYSAWAMSIVDNVERIVREEGVDVIYSTSPPHSVHILASKVSKRTGTPWIMELRDSMTEWPLRKPGAISWLQSRIESFYEPRFYRQADGIVFVTKYQKLHASERYPGLENRPSIVVTNGFEGGIESATEISEVEDEFHITYTGTLSSFDLSSLCEGISLCIATNDLHGVKLVLTFVGEVDTANKKRLDALPAEVGVNYAGIVSHAESLQYQKRAHCLLLIQTADGSGRGAEILTGKVFEYIGSRRPIFAVVKPGELQELINDNRFGVAADSSKPRAIADALGGCLDLAKNWSSSGAMSVSLDKYTRRSQVEEISGFIGSRVGADSKGREDAH